MKCPKCGKDWPASVKFCGACGAKMSSEGGAASVNEGVVVDKLRSLLPSVGLGKFLEPSPGVFLAQKGSTHVTVRGVDIGRGNMAIRSVSTVTVQTPISSELLEFLLRENASLLFGAFGLGPKEEIIYSHTIMASSVDAVELGASVSAVVNMADKYDDQIVQRWGGRTARQMAVESFLPKALLAAALRRKAVRAPAAGRQRPAGRVAGRSASAREPDVSQAVKVNSVMEEYALISRQRCGCGGSYKKRTQALLEVSGLHYDRLDVECAQCGQSKSFLFDINAFFGKSI